jgi:hypothetical protein
MYAALVGTTLYVAGTPTLPGTYSNVTFTVQDSVGAIVTSQPFTITVAAEPTVTSISVYGGMTSPFAGSTIYFIATVADPVFYPTIGTVTFVDSVLGTIGTSTAPYAFGGGSGVYEAFFALPYAYASRGAHTVTAQYQGGISGGVTYFAASPTPSAPVAVNVVNTALVISPNPVSVTAGNPVVINAYVVGATLPDNTYSVNIYDGTTLVGTAKVVKGVATITLTENLAGSISGLLYNFTAQFVGDALFDSAFASVSVYVFTPVATTR